ncbi:hypothetical protein [Nocardia brasiliensis]|uniref:hypothetical protein n=1 Tax=Nocardia brasiliensis TaxID=37326 RepID=UPI00245887C9|nr:hypothetical protein [Nocardia brasiliensis]
MTDAVAAGAGVHPSADTIRPQTVAVSHVAAETMALEAARRALTAAAIEAGVVDYVGYAWIVDDRSSWKRPHHIARMLGADRAIALGIRQFSNGGAAALETAAMHLMLEPRSSTALIVTADRLGQSALGRWNLTNVGAVMSDSATAAVLRRGHAGPLILRSMVSGGRTIHEAGMGATNPLLTDTRQDESVAPHVALQMRSCLRDYVSAALSDAELSDPGTEVAAALIPRIGGDLQRALLAGVLPTTARTLLIDLHDTTGHLYAGDLLANAAHLIDRKILRPGQFALLVSWGAGFTATCGVVQATPWTKCAPRQRITNHSD